MSVMVIWTSRKTIVTYIFLYSSLLLNYYHTPFPSLLAIPEVHMLLQNIPENKNGYSTKMNSTYNDNFYFRQKEKQNEKKKKKTFLIQLFQEIRVQGRSNQICFMYFTNKYHLQHHSEQWRIEIANRGVQLPRKERKASKQNFIETFWHY